MSTERHLPTYRWNEIHGQVGQAECAAGVRAEDLRSRLAGAMQSNVIALRNPMIARCNLMMTMQP